MDIRNVKVGLHQPERTSSVQDAGGTPSGAPAQDPAPQPPVEPGASADRVELSAAAREGGTKAEGIDFAKKALLGMPPLSPDRMDHILTRIQEGYYSQPDVIKEIAERISTEITGRDTSE